MELSDLHHPNCKINRKLNADLGVGVGGIGSETNCRRESESSDSILLSPEAAKATEAVEFIAEHLRNEDLYIQVSGIFIFFYLRFVFYKPKRRIKNSEKFHVKHFERRDLIILIEFL